jgi:multiple antibiotic resistance protein
MSQSLLSNGAFQHYLIGLLAIGNNISALGAFLAHTEGLSAVKLRRTILATGLACLGMLLMFLWFCMAVLDFFGISISAFQIAGGLLLGGVGLNMMNSRQSSDVNVKAVDHKPGPRRLDDDSQLLSTAVVPIAIPLTVGAGTFSTVILFSDLADRSGSRLELTLAILALVLINHLVFSFSARIVHFAGEVGLSVFTKIMGLFTLSIGVEFILRGLTVVYHQLHGG